MVRVVLAVLAGLLRQRAHGYVSPYDVALVYAGLGDKQQALDWLQRAYGERSSLLVFALREPRLAPLRTEPRVKLVHSTHKRAIGVPLERHAFDLGALGIDAMNMHHTEWTAGLVSLFHRFDVRAFAWDTQEVRQIRAVLRMGIDAVYCDRPERMVAAVAAWEAEERSGDVPRFLAPLIAPSARSVASRRC